MKFSQATIVLFVSVILFGCTREDNDDAFRGQSPANDSDPISDSVVHDYVFDGPDLLKNGGLEQWNWDVYYQPAEWSPIDENNIKLENQIVFEGILSAKMKSQKTGETARLAQLIPVTPGSKIKIRFSYYVEQWKAKGARTYCYFRTRAAQSSNISVSELREFYTDEEYYILRGGGRGLTYLPHDLNIWQTFEETINIPPTAQYFEFGVNSYFGTTIYVDDCHVIEGRLSDGGSTPWRGDTVIEM